MLEDVGVNSAVVALAALMAVREAIRAIAAIRANGKPTMIEMLHELNKNIALQTQRTEAIIEEQKRLYNLLEKIS